MILINRSASGKQCPADRFKVTYSPHGKHVAHICSTLDSKSALHDFLVRILKVDPQRVADALATLESKASARID